MRNRYQCFIIGADNKLLARQEFFASDDDDARNIASGRSSSGSREAANTVELWNGARYVGVLSAVESLVPKEDLRDANNMPVEVSHRDPEASFSTFEQSLPARLCGSDLKPA